MGLLLNVTQIRGREITINIILIVRLRKTKYFKSKLEFKEISKHQSYNKPVTNKKYLIN